MQLQNIVHTLDVIDLINLWTFTWIHGVLVTYTFSYVDH